MSNPYKKSEKKYNVQMAAGYVACTEIAKLFDRCQSSSLAMESLFLHYAEMPDKKRAITEGKTKAALQKCSTKGLKDLQADILIRRTKDNLSIIFTTYGYGDVEADIDKRGNVKISFQEPGFSSS